jgi:hypothetical protein
MQEFTDDRRKVTTISHTSWWWPCTPNNDISHNPLCTSFKFYKSTYIFWKYIHIHNLLFMFQVQCESGHWWQHFQCTTIQKTFNEVNQEDYSRKLQKTKSNLFKKSSSKFHIPPKLQLTKWFQRSLNVCFRSSVNLVIGGSISSVPPFRKHSTK